MDAQESQSWFNAAVGVIGGLLGVLWNTVRARVDKLEQGQSDLIEDISHFVPRSEIQEFFAQLRHDNERMHAGNLNRMDRVEDALIRLTDEVHRK